MKQIIYDTEGNKILEYECSILSIDFWLPIIPMISIVLFIFIFMIFGSVNK